VKRLPCAPIISRCLLLDTPLRLTRALTGVPIVCMATTFTITQSTRQEILEATEEPNQEEHDFEARLVSQKESSPNIASRSVHISQQLRGTPPVIHHSPDIACKLHLQNYFLEISANSAYYSTVLSLSSVNRKFSSRSTSFQTPPVNCGLRKSPDSF
jgi:hypothetical protein